MSLTLALVTDIHFGPEARFEGKLRKLTNDAPSLLTAFAERMRSEVRPDLVVNLGDDIEDESLELDRERYLRVGELLRAAGCDVLNVAGNHDTIHLQPADLRKAWGPASLPSLVGLTLYGSCDRNGVHLVTLHTHEVKDESVSVDEAQIAWLERDLSATSLPVVVLMHHSCADQVLTGNRWFEGRPHICLVRERKRLRALFERSGKVVAVINGHLHWNQLTVHEGIPYVTVQSLIENLNEDATPTHPGRAANAHAIVRVEPSPTRVRVQIEVHGAETARYQLVQRREAERGPRAPDAD